MASNSENIKQVKRGIKDILYILMAVLVVLGIYFYYIQYYIIVRFNELGPLSKNMAVYYKGFKIGKISRISPDKDFKHILVKVTLSTSNLDLPQNTIVTVERFPSGELYLQFLYPQSPSLNPLRRGDMVEGIAPYSLEQFMLSQNISGMTDIVSEHIIRALRAADAANQQINIFFRTTTKLINTNTQGITKSVNNVEAMTERLAQMAQNLNQTSEKLNNAIEEQALKDTASNIKDTTDNIKVITQNISTATKDLDKTMQKVDDALSQVHTTAQNIDSVTIDLNKTLSKRFGGMRVMFGTPVKAKN